MNARSKEDEIQDIIRKDLLFIHNHRVELSKRLIENLEDNVSYVRELFAQLSQPSSGPLVPKTPKMLRKKVVQRIETILEGEVFQQENISPVSSLQSVNEEEQKESKVPEGRTKRGASKKAADSIKKQSLILNDSTKKTKRESQIKRKKYNMSSSDEDNNENISKYSKVEKNIMEAKETTKRMTRKKSKQIIQPIILNEKVKITEKIKETNEDDTFKSPILQHSNKGNSKSSQSREINKANDAIVTSNTDDIEEPSMYEDAIGKPVPIMNSTLKYSLFMPEKILNPTVILERLANQLPKLNETVVIQKTINTRNSSKEMESIKKTLPNNIQQYETPAQYNNCNELITDDESSPEVKRRKKQVNKKQTKGMLMISSENEIPNTPEMKICLNHANISAITQENKTTYKSTALFSPYAKESVKKRVEAFEQAVMYSPKSVDADAPTRITRTKTRAMATAEMQAKTKTAEKNVAQILARKSLAKAKKISLAKQKNDDNFKEVKESMNKEQLPERINKLLTQTDKSNVKIQLKTTPLSKIKLMQPTLSLNRHTPSNMQNLPNYPKALIASRTNIVTNVESFIQPSKSIVTTNSIEKLEERRRHEEDARKKKDEALRLQTEEKKRKRQEKELKNKLAREAKEKQELEKRQKAEKEKEEKAKLALLIQEKHREEMERKRLAQLQRIQEKEERRKLEDQQRLQKLQEHEETERLLTEQRRREQEAERRREAEARTQQAAEVLKQKNQLLTAQAKYKQANNKYQSTVNYVLDSEPDDDESDDESKPKHEIPYWAQAHVRKAQLAMQQYIPEAIVYRFFDTRKCTPDLTELFHGIDRNRLKRTSSAIWKTPPRISMMGPEFVEPKLP